MIDSYLLKALLVFSEEGTLLKTSEKLHVSQPALTRSMQKLEEELGVTIFERSRNRICLNDLGTKAASYASRILDLEDEMKTTLEAISLASRKIYFGSVAPAPIFELNPILKKLYPEAQIKSDLMQSEDSLFEGLEKGMYSFIISRIPPEDKGLVSMEYFKESLKVFVPEDHRLASRKSIYLKDLEGETFLMLSELGFWAEIKKQKIPGARFITQEEAENLKEIVASSSLPTFVTDIAQKSRNYPTYSQKGRVSIPILDEEVNVTFYIVLKKENLSRFEPLLENIKDQL